MKSDPVIDGLTKLAARLESSNALLARKVEAYEARHRILLEAVEFYANEDRWHEGVEHYRYNRVLTTIADHGYTIAQRALEAVRDET